MGHLKLAIVTVGCRANQADSAAVVRYLDGRTVRVVRELETADVTVINTCCVTAEAERDCRKLARRALGASPNARVVLIGCAVNANGSFGDGIDDRLERREGDEAAPDRIAAWINGIAGAPEEQNVEENIPAAVLGRTRVLLKIQSGCTHCCAYCIVPRARGPERSLPRQAVLAEAARLVDEGAGEVVLTGVQLGAWGIDLDGKPRLADLVLEVADTIAPGRLRLSSIEPWSVDEDLIQAIASHPRICPHLHVPLQNGDDRILGEMGRGYSSSDYLSIVRRLRECIPDVALGTDVLLGFPGEDEQSFENTINVLAEIAPAYVHAFTYSPRPGTRAAKMASRPPRDVAKQRTRKVRELGGESAQTYRVTQLGQLREVIIEEERPEGLTGLTDNFIPVVIGTEEPLTPGKLVMTRLQAAAPGSERLRAKVVDY